MCHETKMNQSLWNLFISIYNLFSVYTMRINRSNEKNNLTLKMVSR